MDHAAAYLRDLDDYGRTWSNRLKIVLVGLGEAGKTSIAGQLENRLGSSRPNPEERTIGVEIRDIKLGPGPDTGVSEPNVDLDVSLWDFAGQKAYYDTHQMFLTPGALFILVVDMHAYSVKNSPVDALDQWLDILQSRVPGSVVLLVGTHSDLFVANSAECSQRMESFKEDVDTVVKRICSECGSAQVRWENDLGKGQLDSQGYRRYQPLEVVVDDELLALNFDSLDGQDIDLLQRRIEHLAYHGYEGYSFSSVRSVVPEPYLPAIATLEAVRRGADLRGSGGERAEVAQRLREGDPSRSRTFIRFSEALSLFGEQQTLFARISKFMVHQEEERRVFREAIELHEAHGAILVAHVDGGGGSQQKDETGNDMIHVNPSRFADMVRRVVGVKVDPLQQAKVVEEMRASPSARPKLFALTDQHKRFVQAGEVSKDYLRFLWDRDMELGQASRAAPPLHLTEEDINVTVESLLHLRFMFRVRDGHDKFVPDLYVVTSCLPNNPGSEVDPANLLAPKPGCAIYSQKLELCGAHVPPGLVPRLLAWCGRGEGRIEACWKRGVCFSFKNHMVLLYELRATDGSSWIECHASGGVHDESARGVLKDVGDEINELINDAKYGFPSLSLIRGDDKETLYSSDRELEALVDRIAIVLKDQMNVGFRMGRSIGMDVALGRSPIPRLVCVLPAPESQNPLNESERSFREWSARLEKWIRDGKKTGKKFATRELRLFFLCAHDMSLAECGPKGQGYKVKELLSWAKKAKRMAKLVSVLTSIALKVCTGLAIPEADFEATLGTKAGGALSEFVQETSNMGVEAMTSVVAERLDGGGERAVEGVHHAGARSPGTQKVGPPPLQAYAYDQLQEVVRSFEVDGTLKGKSPLPGFEKSMQLVDKDKRGLEWAWVRTCNVRNFMGP
ncbi:unnamed protein product [Ectocarpus sp. 12 AP-2014]